MRYESVRLADFSVEKGKKRPARFDGSFFLLVMLLLGMGVVMVFSASYARAYYDPSGHTGGNAAYYFVRQLLFAVLGTFGMLLASRIPISVYRRFTWHFLALTLVLLLLVPLVGVKANGSRRWLGIGGLTLQPSELAKVCFVYVGASAMERIMNKRNIIGFIVYTLAGCGGLALMNDFGTALVFFTAFLIILLRRAALVLPSISPAAPRTIVRNSTVVTFFPGLNRLPGYPATMPCSSA